MKMVVFLNNDLILVLRKLLNTLNTFSSMLTNTDIVG